MDPGTHPFRPDDEKSMQHHPQKGTVSTTLKAEIDKDNVLAVTTALSISESSKMMFAAKTGTGKKPDGMTQGPAPQSKTEPPKPPVSAPPPATPAAHVKPGHDVKRKSSLASEPGANKEGHKIRFPELDVAEPSGRGTHRGSPKQTADKKVPSVRSSDKYKPGILRELPEKETESQETPSPSKARDDQIKKAPLSTKAEDDGSKEGGKKTSPDVNVQPDVTDNNDEKNSGDKAPKDSNASKTSKAPKAPKKIEQAG